MTCVLTQRACNTCKYCVYMTTPDSANALPLNQACSTELYETLRLCASTETVTQATASSAAPVARSITAFSPAMRHGHATAYTTDGDKRLKRFLRLLAHLDTAPWASTVFNVNDRMIRRLTASHLHLIIGKANFAVCNRSEMYHLIAPTLKLDGVNNVVWVTNRQQGKTSTIGKFIAALAIASPEGGQLVNVYSTSLDRANELTKAAKQYVTWMMTDAGAHPEWTSLRFVKNTYQQFSVSTSDRGAVNCVVSKPKNPDSCRGDAPAAAFFDEIGFMTSSFWYKFALPLLQVTGRNATCTTTPPPADSFFAVFIEKIIARNKLNDYWFALYNHSLACEQCIEMMEADKCCHNLHYIPPWKCMLHFTNLRNLMPKNQIKTFQKEVYGVLDNMQQYYFPKKLLTACKTRSRHPNTFVSNRVPAVWVAIDPAGHSISEMGIIAIIISPDTAMNVLVGAASINVGQCQVAQVQALVRVFLSRLRKHPLVHRLAPIVPIVECNNNEVFAMSIVAAFREFKPIFMPFTKSRFQTYIVDGIGVNTCHENKQSMVTNVYQQLFEGRIVIAATVVTVCRHDIDSRTQQVHVTDTVDALFEQLGRMRDQDDGQISGKTEGGDNDDLAMAYMIAVYWSLSVRATEAACM